VSMQSVSAVGSTVVQLRLVIVTPWPESARELYPPSDRRLSAKLVQTFHGYRVPRGQRDGSLRPYSWLSRPAACCYIENFCYFTLLLEVAVGSNPRTDVAGKLTARHIA
jgi:hypothetical protein